MAEKTEIIYIKADRNIEVDKEDVAIGDVMEVECTDATVLARVKSLKLVRFHDTDEKKRNRITMSVLKVIAVIHEAYPKIEIQNLGETDFIITFERQKSSGGIWHMVKAILVVAISFTGAAFSIATFNNDVDLTGIFHKIYQNVTGLPPRGNSILELTYSLGIIIGILIFFNHFGKKRFTVDPTPIEVEMRLYENDLQTTLIENSARKGKEKNVDSK